MQPQRYLQLKHRRKESHRGACRSEKRLFFVFISEENDRLKTDVLHLKEHIERTREVRTDSVLQFFSLEQIILLLVQQTFNMKPRHHQIYGKSNKVFENDG